MDITGGCFLVVSLILKGERYLQGLQWRNVVYEPPWGFGLFNVLAWCWNNERILQEFSWCEMSPKLILFWAFHCYHFPLWVMRNACETICCSRELLFHNPFIKQNKIFGLWFFFSFFLFFFFFFFHKASLVYKSMLVVTPAPLLPKGLSLLTPDHGTHLWMALPFWEVQWDHSSPLLWSGNYTSKALWCASPSQGKHNSEVTEGMLQRSCSSLINVSAVVGAMIVRNASCRGV